jgi:hypothetical protein
MHDCVFKDTLKYTAPTHGDWGLVRIAAMVPESRMLFVCPSACGRHGALGAIDQGFKEQVAYVYIDQADIIDGYDKAIRRHTAELLQRLKKQPRAFMLFVSCLDSLIGTDLDALMRELHADHPHIAFRYGRMNPISLETSTPPAVTAQDAMFDFLEKTDERTNSVNLLGNLVELCPENELFSCLRACGTDKVNHLSQCRTFDEFQRMAQSRYNLVLSPIAWLAAENMRKKHGTEYLTLRVTYDMEEVRLAYEQLLAFFKQEMPCDFTSDAEKTWESIERARVALGNTPVVLSSGAALKPFGLAKALCQYGFRVAAVVAEEVLPFDRVAYEWVSNRGDIKIIPAQAPTTIQFKDRLPGAVCIGYDAAYIAGSKHIADLSGDHGMFGYHGIRRLMDMLVHAKKNEFDLHQLIMDYGLVI